LLMGFQNWDDQSRAEHTGARDYANNFLQSCAPNAIIFTYGDNDTYPLWYAQEVEGIRTDVRVVNFSLLAVDWYIDQLRRKMNNSEAIPMTIPKDAYRGSARNYMRVLNSGPMNVIDVLKSMASGENVPTAEINFPVDKSMVRKYSAVPASFPDSLIQNVLNLRLESNIIYKDDVALLDIVGTNAANGWKRPIYFAVTVRPEKIGSFRSYLQLEGMAQRIVPIKSSGNETAGAMSMGRTEIDTMYRNMMERFKWGNFDKKKMFVDESYSPSIQTQQYAFWRLINELKRTGDKERTLKVLDKMHQAFPHFNFPIDEYYTKVSLGLYIELGAEDKAKPHILNLANATAEKLKYFSQFIAPQNASFLDSINQASGAIEMKRQQLSRFIQSNGGTDKLNEKSYGMAMSIQQEIEKLQFDKAELLKKCNNGEMVTLFENDIANAVNGAQSAVDYVAMMKDGNFRKQIESILTPYGIKSRKQLMPEIIPDTKPEAKDSASK
jgi:hypothetical protein